jgi:hypothetical protein
MDDVVESVPVWLSQYPPPRRAGPKKWLVVGGATLALLLALGVGALVGSQIATTHAAAATAGGSSLSASGPGPGGPLNFQAGSGPLAGTPGPSGQCQMLTVTAVNGSTITGKAADGSTVTIETTATTSYTQAGQSVTLAAVKVGSRISVMGTHNSDGSITATSIDIP